MKNTETLTFRPATENDTALILSLIKELAVYEKMENEVITTEDTLREWLFTKQRAEVLIGETHGQPVGYALFFHSFSTFLGRAGIYLEDLYIRPQFRGNGFGKAFLKKLAAITVERECGRLEWCCLDWNQPSIDFYLSQGARPLNDWTTYRVEGKALTALAK